MIWLRHFLLAQGYKRASKIVILQDNQSAIFLEQNGILSSTKRTKHLNVRYFFIKNKIDSGEVTVKWCPTEKMVADYLTKPLTGEKFRKFRGKIMNIPYNAAKKPTGKKDGEVNTSKSLKKLQSGKAMMQVNNGFDACEVNEVGTLKWSRVDKNKKNGS